MSDKSKKKAPSFRDFVHAKDGGIDPADGLAGWGYDGPYKYPEAPEKGYAFTEPNPYSNPDEPDDKTGQVWVARPNDGTPLGDKESPGMNKATPLGKKPDLKKAVEVHPWKRLTNEQYLSKSKSSSPSQLLESDVGLEPIVDLFGNQFTPEPNQTINYLIGILAKSPRMMDRFIIEAKNRGAFEKILESMMQHQSCFDGIVEMFGRPVTGKSHAHQLASALHDKYSSALDAVDLGESVQPDVKDRFGSASETAAGDITTKNIFGGNPGQGVNGSDYGNDEFNEKPGQKNIFGGGDSSGGQSPSTMNAGQGAGEGGGMPDPASGMPDFGDNPKSAPPPGSPMSKKMKAETAAGNLFEASARHPHLKGLMMDMCKDGNC